MQILDPKEAGEHAAGIVVATALLGASQAVAASAATFAVSAPFAGFDVADIALTVNRIVLGAFFFASGWHKLFHPKRRAVMLGTMREFFGPRKAKPLWAFVSAVEFLSGGACIIGLLAPLAAVGMLGVLVVACMCILRDEIKKAAPVDAFDYVNKCLYIPEVLLIVMALLVVLGGSGPWSIDAAIIRAWGLQ